MQNIANSYAPEIVASHGHIFGLRKWHCITITEVRRYIATQQHKIK